MIKPGIYGLQNILGAKVRIISSPAYDMFGVENDKIHFVEKVEFRVETDGKLRVSVILDGLENCRYSPSDLMILEMGKCDTQTNNL